MGSLNTWLYGVNRHLGRHLVCDVRLEGRKFLDAMSDLITAPMVAPQRYGELQQILVTFAAETLLHGGEMVQVGEWRGLVEFVALDMDFRLTRKLTPVVMKSWEEFTGTQPIASMKVTPTEPPNSISMKKRSPRKRSTGARPFRLLAGFGKRFRRKRWTDSMREALLVDNPIVHRLHHGRHQTDISGLVVTGVSGTGNPIDDSDLRVIDSFRCSSFFS